MSFRGCELCGPASTLYRSFVIMKYLHLFLRTALTVFLLGSLRAAEKAPAPQEHNPSLAQVSDIAGLPRVLLLGDSISIGYTLPTRALLAGKANVHRPAENCADSGNGVRKIASWLDAGKWDVIHFNFGLHDVKYLDDKGALVSPEKGKQVASVVEYEQNLRALVMVLEKTEATLIFATTTPVPAGSAGRVERSEIPYNAAAIRVMKENKIAVNDLHAFVAARQDKIQLPKNVHFSEAGSDELAAAVVASIAPFLSKKTKE